MHARTCSSNAIRYEMISILNDFLKINKRMNKINGRNMCRCLNEIVVRADIHL